MIFALQHTQARQQAALQLKLDEILRVLPGTDARVVRVETPPEAELSGLIERQGQLRAEALTEAEQS